MTYRAILSFLLFANVATTVFGQEASTPVSSDIEAIKNIHREFDLHMSRKKTLLQEYERITQTLKSTETEFQKLANDNVQKQMAKLMLEWNQAMLESSIIEESRSFDIRTTGPNLRPHVLTSELNLVLNLGEQSTVAIDLQQIEGAGRVVVERRLKTFQDGAKWREDYSKWTGERPGYFYQYWRFTDPSLVYSQPECERLLETLKLKSNENWPASLAVAILELRLGQTNSANQTLNEIVEMRTPLHNVALAGRAIVFAYEGDMKKAKAEIASSLKIDPSNAYVRFMRARIAASERDWPKAEQDFKAVQKVPNLSIDVTRNLAFIQAMKAEKNDKLVPKITEKIKLLHALVGTNDWQSELLTAWAHKIANEKDQALAAATTAETLARDDNRTVCTDLYQAINDDEQFEWDFLRGEARGRVSFTK